MTNYILDFDKEELDDFIVSDYRSSPNSLVSIVDFIEENNLTDYYFSKYKISNDDKMERISYDIYGTTNYWDILCLINDRDPLFDMPYNDDTKYSFSEAKLNLYNLLYSHKPLNAKRSNELLEEFLQDCEVDNESNRYINIVPPSKMGEFLKLLRDKDII